MHKMLRARAGALQALSKHLLYYFWYKSVAVCRASLGNSLDHILSVDVYLKNMNVHFTGLVGASVQVQSTCISQGGTQTDKHDLRTTP